VGVAEEKPKVPWYGFNCPCGVTRGNAPPCSTIVLAKFDVPENITFDFLFFI
jgi:hypothetical protein